MGADISKVEALFNQLDTDHNGKLQLNDLLTLQRIPGIDHPVTRSLMLLFRLDEDKDGSISTKGAMQLVNDLSEKGVNLPLRPAIPEPFHSEADTESNTNSTEAVSSASITTTEPPSEATDNGESFSGSKNDDDTQSMLVVPHGEYSHIHVRQRKRQNQTEEEQTGIKLEALLKSTMAFMNETLHNADSRETFEKWLFKLADVHGTGRIGTRELEMLMKGLEFDGITCDDLTGDSDRRRSDAERVQCLLDEYDTNKSGFLTEDEFMVLARAVTTNYQLHSADLHSDMIGGYQLSKKLSQGIAGMVRVGTTRKGKMRAVQIVPTRDLPSQYIMGEVKQMIRIFHPNVIHMEEVFEANDLSFFVMELVSGGNLGAHLRMGPFSECQAQHFFRQILNGVEYCHSQLVFHRNLMLENVLLMNDGTTVKVGGFGNAIRVGCKDRIIWNMINLPPEAINGPVVSSEKIDVWALGVLLYRMLAGVPPFYSEDFEEMKQKILKGSYPALTGCSEEAADIVRRMLVVDHDKRATIQELALHPWIDCKPTPWVPSLLHEEYHADCESMSRDIIIMILHDIIRQHNIRTTHPKKGSDDVICQALNRDLKFLIRIGSTTMKEQEELQQQEEEQQESVTAEVNDKKEETTSAAEETPTVIPTVSVLNEGENAEEKIRGDSPALSPLIMQNDSTISTEEHLFLQFVMLEGYGLEFRSVVDSIETALERHLRAAALVKAAPPTCLNTELLLQNAAVLAEQFREVFVSNLQSEKATVLMLGKTGAGKSSLANRIFGTQLAEVGHGKSVTKHFTKYMLDGKPVVIYDSRGYQVDTVQEFEEEIREFFALHSGGNQEDRIHVVWYVVDGTSCRFEPFETVFCSTVLADVPKIILVNKADLCRQQEIQALKKTIEGLQIPKCASVMPTVAVDTLKPPPDKCPLCNSDDVSALRKKRIWKCNECGYVGSMESQSSLEDTMLRRVVEATQMIVPEYVREAFVSGQRISINTKIACTKGIITECFNAFKDTNNKLAIRRVLSLLARICTLWDISPLEDSHGNDNSEDDMVAMPVARQVLSMALPLLRQGRTQEDIELSDEIRKDANITGDGTGEHGASANESDVTKSNSDENLDSGTTKRIGAEHDDGMKWGWGFVLKVQKTLGILENRFAEKRSVQIAHQRPQLKNPSQTEQFNSLASLSASARYSFDAKRTPRDRMHSSQSSLAPVKKSVNSDVDPSGRSSDSSPSSSASESAGESLLLAGQTESGDDSSRQRFSLELPAGEPFRPMSSAVSIGKFESYGGDPQCVTTSSQSVCPSHACLVTTAVTLAWSESLMKMHLLIVERGIKVHRGMSTVARVRSCFDRAFASFNIDRIEMLEEKLSMQPLNDVLDSILVMPDLPNSLAPKLPPSTSPSPMYSILSPPATSRYPHTLSAAASPALPEQ